MTTTENTTTTNKSLQFSVLDLVDGEESLMIDSVELC